MIDTVALVLPGVGIERMVDHLGTGHGHEVRYSNQSGRNHRWQLRNMTVSVDERGAMLYGSLHKYILGNNIETLTRKSIAEALNDLGSVLDLPVHAAKVMRFDAGVNLVLEEPVSSYYQLFGDRAPYKQRVFRHETLAYDLKRRTLQFYDKIAEMKANKRRVPVAYSSANVMRYEVQWKKRVNRQWGRSVLADDLKSNGFHSKIADRMLTEFERIPKIQSQTIIRPTKMKEFIMQLAFKGIDAYGGVSSVVDLLESGRKAGFINSVDLCRAKKKIYEMANDPEIVTKSPLLRELEGKLSEALNFYRAA